MSQPIRRAAARRASLGWVLAAACALAACEQDVVLPGERFDTRVPLTDILPGPDGIAPASFQEARNSAQAITLPDAVSPSAWTSSGFNNRNRLPHLALRAEIEQVWATPIGAGNTRRNRITADPVVDAGRVITLDSRAQLQATELSDGTPLWTRDLVPDFDSSRDISGGGLALADGRLIATTGYGELIALDPADGAILWRQRLGTVLGAPAVRGDTIYVVGRNGAAWAVETRDGRLKWQIPLPDAPSVLAGGAVPAFTDRAVLFAYPSGEVVANLPETGFRLWGTVVAGGRLGQAYASLNDITADPVVVGNSVYVGNQSGRVVSLDALTGDENWSARDGAYSPVTVAGGSVFFVSDRNELLRLNAQTGARIWGTELPLFVEDGATRRKAIYAHYGPILVGGRLLLASSDGFLRFFDPVSGAETGQVTLERGAASHPIVVDETLLVISEAGLLHAYR